MSAEKLQCEMGSGNIFKDLGIPEPEEYLKKSHLAFIIEDCITESGLRLEEAAEILNLSATKLSNLLDGLLDDFSVEELTSLITKLKSVTVDTDPGHIDRFLQWFQQLVDRLSYSKSEVIGGRAAVGFCVIAFLFVGLVGPRVYQNSPGQRSEATNIPNPRSEVAQIEMERQAHSNYPTSTNKKDDIPLSLTVPTVIGDDESK
ncbi:MAG: XRE family transcriptional regulator [Candidatus Poribacteria bacterium]|nr:XRE family transcriptional regulator [Candidatus Poribacteria bacterium]